MNLNSRNLIASALLALGAMTPAHADVAMKIVTPKGYVAFTVGDDWKVVQLQSKTPVATAVYQVPNPADEKTTESTNLVLILYDLATERGRRRFNMPLPTYGENKPAESKLEGYALLTGMGPTYFWFHLQALRDVAAGFGLSGAEIAPALKRMVCGATRTVLESGLTPSEVKDSGETAGRSRSASERDVSYATASPAPENQALRRSL